MLKIIDMIFALHLSLTVVSVIVILFTFFLVSLPLLIFFLWDKKFPSEPCLTNEKDHDPMVASADVSAALAAAVCVIL